MDKIEMIIEKALSNNREISIEEIYRYNLTAEEYKYLFELFKKYKIVIVEEIMRLNEPLHKTESDYYSEDSFAMFMHEISNYPILTSEEELELLKKYHETGNKKYKDKLVKHNLRWVCFIAKKYYANDKSGAYDLLDAIQEGTIGLMKAIDKFDVSTGYRLSTYSFYWIRQSISREMNKVANPTNVPLHASEKGLKLRKYIYDYELNTGKKPTNKECAKFLNTNEEEIYYLLLSLQEVKSLETPISEDGDSTLADVVGDDGFDMYDSILTKMDCKFLYEDMKKLFSPKEYEIILQRMGIIVEGIGSNYPMTLDEIGEYNGVTRERIRQIEHKALVKIRSYEKTKKNRMEKVKKRY